MSKKMTTSEPTTGEIVRALRNCLDVGCEECILHETDITPEYKVHYCGAPNKVADRLEAQERTIADKDAKIAALTARAEQAERERDAAKADMKLIVDAVRETHCDDTCCFACKHDCDTSINDSGEFNNECPGFDRDDCFEWRGTREGERND